MQGTEKRFTIRRADGQDVDAVLQLMEQVKSAMEYPEWYVTDEQPWIKRHVEQEGFILLAEAEHGELAGYFIVDFPAKRADGMPDENLGAEISLREEELRLVAHMDSAAVAPKYRGWHLQGRLLEAAERELEGRKERHFLCTVHPDNHASLHTMQNHGYAIAATKEKYGGLPRHVLYKKKEPKETKACILVSACLLGVCCRYNGKGVLDGNVSALMDEAQLIPVCPEIMGGLATPREPAERVGAYVVTKTGSDVTGQYRRGAEETLKLAKLYGCACAILKERSPSCGSGMIYDGSYTGKLTAGDGVTAEVLKANGISVFGESQTAECRKMLVTAHVGQRIY